MHRTVERILRVSTMILVACGYFALATTRTFPPVILLVPFFMFVCMPLAEWIDGRFQGYRRLLRISTALMLVAIPCLFLFMDLLRVVICVVIYIQIYSILQRKTPMNYRHLYLMAFFLLLATCVLAPEPAVGLAMGTFLISAIVAFVSLQLHVEFENHHGVAVADVLLHDEDGLMPGTPTRMANVWLAVAVVALCLAALGLTGGFFVFTPRMEAGLLGRGDASLSRSQLDEAVNLAKGGIIMLDQTAIMRVAFPDEPDGRYQGDLYWRCTTLPQYWAANWQRAALASIESEPAFALSARTINVGAFGQNTKVRREGKTGNRREIRQSIYVNDVPSEGVPALSFVQRMDVSASARNGSLNWDINGDGTVVFGERGQRWLEYNAWSDTERPSPETLRAAPDNYREVLSFRDYKLLTYHSLSPETVRTVDRLVQGKTNVYEKTMAIVGYLNNGQFRYSRTLPELPPEAPIDAFLNTTHIGHCELFASAMALMLRSQGIPTRVVSGYHGGEWSAREKVYVVGADMAHMWVEVYFLGVGWVTFDPSPPDPSANTLAGSFRRWISWYTLRMKMIWYRDVISYNRGYQLGVLRNLRIGFIKAGSSLWAPVDLARGGISALPTAIFAILSVTGMLVWFLRYRPARRKALHLSPAQERVVRVYAQVRRALEKAGRPCAGKAAEEICAQLAGAQLAVPVTEIVEIYNAVRFGGKPLPPEQIPRLKANLRQLKHALKDLKPEN